MSDSPSPLQTLILWRLLFLGGQFSADIKPELKAPDRRFLESMGLIETLKRPKPSKNGKARPVNFVQLTEQGWEWASRHLDHPLSQRSPAAAAILQSVLGTLQKHLDVTGTPLVDFVTPPERPGDALASPTIDAPPAQLPAALSLEQVRSAYRGFTENRPGRRVRLADLRRVLPQVEPAVWESSFLRLERDRCLVLYPLDDPREIHPEDTSAAIPNSVGQKRHLVYLES